VLDRIAERREREAEAENLRVGLIASILHNQNRKRGSRPLRPGDFFLQRAEPQTTEQMRAALDRLAARQNAQAH
jgi:hypothetical protein